MQCPRCGSEESDVIRTRRNQTPEGKYSPVSDLRIQKCRTCGKTFSVDCYMAGVQIFDADTMTEKTVSPEEYEKKHLSRELSRTPRQGGLFDDGVER